MFASSNDLKQKVSKLKSGIWTLNSDGPTMKTFPFLLIQRNKHVLWCYKDMSSIRNVSKNIVKRFKFF
jgi:hypothetical protein